MNGRAKADAEAKLGEELRETKHETRQNIRKLKKQLDNSKKDLGIEKKN
jgi:hypothetical protein